MKMAIFGLARSGMSALKHQSSQGRYECYAVNRGTPKSWESYEQICKLIDPANCVDEEEAVDLMGEMDLIVKSPGIAYTHPALVKARANKVEIISEIEYAYRHSDIPVVAVTGTNGKTTTATMINELLEMLGKKVFLGGNIGIPYSEVLLSYESYDWAVIEVSSFQLENIKSFKPRLAILTNISPSHGERYDSHELYRDAKLKLFQNMNEDDTAIVPRSFYSLNLPCNKKSIKALDQFDFSKSKLVGEHNKENLYCAYVCAQEIIEDKELVDSTVQKYIDNFGGVEYRIQFIRSTPTLDIYNDGKSTNMASTLAAVDSFEDRKLHLILGGKLRDRTMDFSELVNRDIESVYAFGDSKDFVREKLNGHFSVSTHSTMEELFEALKSDELDGVLLFSPAFPSFDLFKNYEHRAKRFNELAKEL
ncbi:MAG: UDP-N-acetylmuramoyl-L-alanine--D-glutamate ligase [Bacteriovoracaceae bacterium]|nr:UDP-N-acetylmuramoyl-L-alanine--D-glutamate ligase [Bacteriovoracaceae bacterium]